MTFVKFLAGANGLTNNHVEGCMIIPLAVALPGKFSFGHIAEVDFDYNDVEDDYRVDYIHTGAVGHDIVGNLADYVEYIGIALHNNGSTYRSIGSTELTYVRVAKWIVDTKLTLGTSDNTDDVSSFVSTPYRFCAVTRYSLNRLV